MYIPHFIYPFEGYFLVSTGIVNNVAVNTGMQISLCVFAFTSLPSLLIKSPAYLCHHDWGLLIWGKPLHLRTSLNVPPPSLSSRWGWKVNPTAPSTLPRAPAFGWGNRPRRGVLLLKDAQWFWSTRSVVVTAL